MAETLASLMELTSAALYEMAATAGIPGRSLMRKETLAAELFARQKADESAPKPQMTAAKAIKKGADDAVLAAVADIHSAFDSDVKIAQVANADPDFAAAVMAALTPAEHGRVCFGNPAVSVVR